MHPSRRDLGLPLPDPFHSLPRLRPWVWSALALVVIAVQGPGFVRSLRPEAGRGNDFFQEWASARNVQRGLPAYASIQDSLNRYLGGENTFQVIVPVNAHPPTSILFALPFAHLDYPDATLAWNLCMLGLFLLCVVLVWRELRIPFTYWSVAPAVVLTLLCNPLRQQFALGQLNLLLLPLLVGGWIADRRGWALGTGVMVGLATAIKLFPGLLFLYLVLGRNWRGLTAGVVTFLVTLGITAVVLGTDSIRAYVVDVIPQLQYAKSGWGNLSITGVWTKLFDPHANLDRVEPLVRWPWLARAGALLSSGLVVVALAWAIVKARRLPDRGLAFGLTLTAMLLVSPIAWDHYLLLLMVPLAVTWTHLPRSNGYEMAFAAIVVAFWLDPLLLYRTFIPGEPLRGPAYPVHTLLVLSFQCWALLAFFALQWGLLRASPRPVPPPAADSR